MTKLLLRLFVKNHADLEDPRTRAKIGKMSGLVGVFCNLLIVGLKMTVGVLSGAFSIVADAMNNLSDAASAIVTLIGFKLAEKPADRDHPYGHARYEYLSGLAVAAMILLIGFNLLQTSVEKILHPMKISYTLPVYLILLFSVGVKLWMALFNRYLGKYINSTALLATSADSRNDAITTGAILLSAAFASLTGLTVDGYVSLALSLFIMYGGVQLGKETISPILGETASPELRNAVTKLLGDEPLVLDFHDLMIHDYGPGQCFGSIHVEMDYREDPLKCHEVIDNLERACLQQHNIHLVIHYDPVVTDNAQLSAMRCTVESLLKKQNAQITIHDFRMVRGKGHTNLIFDMVLPPEMMPQRYAIKDTLDQALNELDTGTYYTVIEFDMTGFN